MANPKIVQKGFQVEDLKPGTYFWCSCGESKNQPYCDGSHKGSEFQPKKIEVSSPTRIKFCLCKHTKSANGACDGSHNNL